MAISMKMLKKGFKGLLEIGEMVLSKGQNILISLLVIGVILGVAVGGSITVGGDFNSTMTNFGNTVAGYFDTSGEIIVNLGIIISLVVVAVLIGITQKGKKGDQ